MIGIEIFSVLTAVGRDIPSKPLAFTFVAVDTAASYFAGYPGTERGKTASYILCWINSRGEKGPWSEVFSATIGV